MCVRDMATESVNARMLIVPASVARQWGGERRDYAIELEPDRSSGAESWAGLDWAGLGWAGLGWAGPYQPATGSNT